MSEANSPENTSSADPASPASVEQTPDPKDAIDLNEIFPDSEKDLNNLFLDDDIKQLLKNVSKNKTDLEKLNDRLWEENKGEEEEAETESSSSDATPTSEDPTLGHH